MPGLSRLELKSTVDASGPPVGNDVMNGNRREVPCLTAGEVGDEIDFMCGEGNCRLLDKSVLRKVASVFASIHFDHRVISRVLPDGSRIDAAPHHDVRHTCMRRAGYL